MSTAFLDELPDNWREALEGRLDTTKIDALGDFLTRAYEEETVYPPREDMFNAFRQCSFESARVLILGQDPYHGEGQANGLSFSVRDGVPLPPSLRNIYKELADDPEVEFNLPAAGGDLTWWAKQGVLLLNTVLTVRASDAHSHRRRGWEHFTDAVIHLLAAEKEAMVFTLWGAPAGKKVRLIEATAARRQPYDSSLDASESAERGEHPWPQPGVLRVPAFQCYQRGAGDKWTRDRLVDCRRALTTEAARDGAPHRAWYMTPSTDSATTPLALRNSA